MERWERRESWVRFALKLGIDKMEMGCCHNKETLVFDVGKLQSVMKVGEFSGRSKRVISWFQQGSWGGDVRLARSG